MVAKLDPAFGYANGFDEPAGLYRNLAWARDPPDPMPPTALIVRSAEARDQLKREAEPRPDPAGFPALLLRRERHGSRNAAEAARLIPLFMEMAADIRYAGVDISRTMVDAAVANNRALVDAGLIIGNALCALAPSYWLLLGARLVIAGTHGLFFGVTIIVATRLVPKERQASAVSFVMSKAKSGSGVGMRQMLDRFHVRRGSFSRL